MSVAECLNLLGERSTETKILSGGQSLVPLMNLRLARPEVVVDINGLAELAFERRDGPVLEVGALARHVEIAESAMVRTACPLVADAASRIGYPAIRNRGTLGGSVAHADPAAELPCACLALGAEIVVRGPEGERRVPADHFFVSHFTTTLSPSEMVVAVRFPATRQDQGSAFEEFARKTGDFAVVAVGAVVTVTGRSIEHAAISVAGVGGRPIRTTAAEASLVGEAPSSELFATIASAVTTEVAGTAGEDAEGLRSHISGVLAARALAKACKRAVGGEAPNGK